MRFDDLVQRVHDTEHALELQRTHTGHSWRGLRTSWREGWTPTRIVLAGLLSGFVVGRVKPWGKVVGLPASRWVQIVTSLGAWRLVQGKDANTADTPRTTPGVLRNIATDTGHRQGRRCRRPPVAADMARAAASKARSRASHPPDARAPRCAPPRRSAGADRKHARRTATEMSER